MLQRTTGTVQDMPAKAAEAMTMITNTTQRVLLPTSVAFWYSGRVAIHRQNCYSSVRLPHNIRMTVGMGATELVGEAAARA